MKPGRQSSLEEGGVCEQDGTQGVFGVLLLFCCLAWEAVTETLIYYHGLNLTSVLYAHF